MDAANEGAATPMKGRTNLERTSDREFVVRRTFAAPARVVFQAWSRAELFMRWWAPKSMGVPIRSCEMDVRTGGKYRLEFGHDAENTFAFYGKYLEVIPNARIVWTNDEGEEGAVTTVTFEEDGGRTVLMLHEIYPTKDAADEALASGSLSGYEEQFAQLDAFLATRDGGAGQA